MPTKDADGNSILNDVLAACREQLRMVLPSERINFIDKLMEDYCPRCGWTDPNHSCQCWNDELSKEILK